MGGKKGKISVEKKMWEGRWKEGEKTIKRFWYSHPGLYFSNKYISVYLQAAII